MPELTQTVEPSLEAILGPLVERRQSLKAEISSSEAAIDELNDEIKTTLVQAGVLEVVVAGHKVTLDPEREKSTLDKRLLLEQGVTTEQLKRATKVSTFVQLDVRKAGKAEAE